MLKKIVVSSSTLLIIAVLNIGCAGPGTGAITSNVSKMDGVKEVVMQTAWVAPAQGGMAELSLGMTYRDLNPEELLLKVNITKMSATQDIQSVVFKTDSKTTTAKVLGSDIQNNDLQITNDTCVKYYGMVSCQKGMTMKSVDKVFIVPSRLVKEILDAKNAYIRVEVDHRTVEGDLKASSFGNATFKDSLPDFLQQISK